jgi:hypothetical protein
MSNGDGVADPIAMGRQKADEILKAREAALARRTAALAVHPKKLELSVQLLGVPAPAKSLQTAGFLAAAGDSWFDYPFYDVLKLLEDDYGYNIESAAHAGDPIESMAYQGGQLDNLVRCLEKIAAQGAVPKAVLLSGGGDDIAGKEFGMLLNNATSAIGGWNDEIVDGVLNQRIVTAYKFILGYVTQLCVKKFGKALPILVHGYDYPVPDGRGFLGGGWFLPGPWLKPGFDEKLFKDLAKNIVLMHDVLDRFNNMLLTLAKSPPFGNVHYVDLRGTLKTDATYTDWWGNELHPTLDGFRAVADRFAKELSTL